MWQRTTWSQNQRVKRHRENEPNPPANARSSTKRAVSIRFHTDTHENSTTRATNAVLLTTNESPREWRHCSHLVDSVFVAHNTSEHRCDIFGVRKRDELIAVQGQRNEFQSMHDTVEKPIEVVALVGQWSVDVLRPERECHMEDMG